MGKTDQLFMEASYYIPGGVNSPVRACLFVGERPRFIQKSKGAYLWDIEGQKYIDYIGSFGPMILGHNNEIIREAVKKAAEEGLSYGGTTKREVDMARLMCALIPHLDMVRMVNSGTEAVMSAVRTARGYTGRNKILKFTGCYHGHSDNLLVEAGSGIMTAGLPSSAGVPKGCVQDTISIPYNDLEGAKKAFALYPEEIACVLVEPVAANMGVVLPKEGFLEGLRNLCTKEGALLIFDEVITGFRLSIEGGAGYFQIEPDLSTYGKIIGGGMPIGAYGGRRDIMEWVAPLGPVYQAGTLSGNPIAMAAGIAQLTLLKEDVSFYEKLEKKTNNFFEKVKKMAKEKEIPIQINHIGSIGSIFFTKNKVTDYEGACTSNREVYADYYKYMLDNGIYLPPSPFEAMFFSKAHGEEELLKTWEILEAYFLKDGNWYGRI